jgi:Type II restriction endonuclease EcoO109I
MEIYLVGIKSGPNWGNKDQTDAMKNNFKTARQLLGMGTSSQEIIAVNGCACMEKIINPIKLMFLIKSGVISNCADKSSGNLLPVTLSFTKELLYRSTKRQKRGTIETYAAKINEMTKDFSEQFLTEQGYISWDKIIDFVSKKNGTNNTQIEIETS